MPCVIIGWIVEMSYLYIYIEKSIILLYDRNMISMYDEKTKSKIV